MKEIKPWLQFAAKNKYVLLVFAVGLTLLLLPRSTGTAERTASASAVRSAPTSGTGIALPLEASGIPMDTEERRLALALSQMEGVGEVGVLLSMEGAVVICGGAEDPKVRLEVTGAVSLYTGLGYDRIQVVKMKP